MNISRKRILKELSSFDDSKDETIVLKEYEDIGDLAIDIYVKNHPNYNGDIPFTISYKITNEYPFQPPIVQFVGHNIPMHPHIYSNGHICLDALYDNWSAAQSVLSISLSLQSMLQSNTVMARPEGDQSYCLRAPKDPSKTSWMYHDDTV